MLVGKMKAPEQGKRPTPEQMARNLRTAFDLHTAGVRMYRQTLRRKHPEASEEEIAERLRAWLHHRPGAEHGDAEGEPGTWPRTQARASSKSS